MSTGQRPLSPHLQVYKPEFTSGLSILHRITGVALAVGTLLLVCWLFAVSGDAAGYASVQSFWGSIIGRLLLFGWSFALFYHLCNGIRHLFWDIGKGFDLATAQKSAIAVIVVATGLTLAAWIMAYASMGKL